MKEINEDRILSALKRHYWEPEAIVNDWNYSGIQLRVRKETQKTKLGDIKNMTIEELQEWWSEYALLKPFSPSELRLHRPIINKKRQIVMMPKKCYRIKDFVNEDSLAIKVVDDLTWFFNIIDEF